MSLFATIPNNIAGPLGAERIARFANIPVANIGDAMERLGVLDSAIRPVWRGGTFVGTALTVWTRAGDNRYIHEALESATEGDVIVVNGEGDTSRALMGELIGGRAKARGVRAFVIDGAVRDADGLANYDMPVFARAVTAAGPYRDGPGVIGATVAVGGVAVNPGDLVVGDADGVVVVPRHHAAEVLIAAEKKHDQEQSSRMHIEKQMQLDGRQAGSGVGLRGARS